MSNSFEIDGDFPSEHGGNEHEAVDYAGTATCLGSATGAQSTSGELPEEVLRRGRGRPAGRKVLDGDQPSQ
eukprot:3425273-Amphidinium_carterae.1